MGYKYLDKLQVNGPIRVAVVKGGRLVKAVGAGTGLQHTLVEDPDPVGAVLSLGARRYCMSFGGTATFVTPRKFVALSALAPGACPP